jgi:hypothetical protein
MAEECRSSAPGSLVFKSSTSRPGAPRTPTGEFDLTFWASRSTSWRLDFSSQLVVDLADQVCPAQGPLGTLKPFFASCCPTPLLPLGALPLSSVAAAAALPLFSVVVAAAPHRPPPLHQSSALSPTSPALCASSTRLACCLRHGRCVCRSASRRVSKRATLRSS